jgi:prophage tail gpP-like protein
MPRPHDDVLLKLPTCIIGGWLSVRVTRSIERCPNDFEIRMTESFPALPDSVVLQPGDPCQIYLGKTLCLTGYIDRVIGSMDKGQHELVVTGRGKCGDLVDCSALWPGNQITNSDLKQVASKLAQPYGIEVSVAAGQDVGAAIPMFNFGLGETAFSIIETMCRYRAFLAYELPDGSLRLERASSDRAASALHEGVNVEVGSLLLSMDERFQVYDSYLVGIDVFADAGTAGNQLKSLQDLGVPRFRHRYVHVEAPNAMGEEVQLSRARWELNRRIGRSVQARITTDTWRDKAGNLYEPNTLIEVKAPSIKLPQMDLLIAEVSYLKDDQGTHCELLLMPPKAFDVQPPTYPGWLDVVKTPAQ